MRAALYQAELHYPGLTLHTAASGSVPALQELYLHLDDDGIDAVGEVRINISYLNGYSARQVLDDARAALGGWDWSLSAAAQLARLDDEPPLMLAPTRMLLDVALHDLRAKQAGVSVAALLGATDGASGSMPTNQTLFWGDDAALLRQAQAYVARGFTDLKLRVGVADFARDRQRLALLRERFGDGIQLAADANGQWSPAQAAEYLPALAPFNLRYLEQPIAPADIAGLDALAAASPVPLMLDESASSAADFQRLEALQGRVWAHLKLVKMGGIGPVARAARRLSAAGVPLMVGQMNEGAAATAAALQVACLVQPRFTELYGADGLNDDPVSGLRYHQGRVQCLSHSGLGVTFQPDRAHFIQEFHHARHW